MELRQLKTFEAVLASGSFTRAADALFLTQPAVTRQIAALESELKVKLFDRLGRNVSPTAAGFALHDYAEAMLRLESDIQLAMQDIRGGAAGRLCVGASNTVATYILPPILKSFKDHFPGVEIAVQTGISARVLELVCTNESDIGLVTTDVLDPLLNAIVLQEYETRVVVPPNHLLASQSSVSAADLSKFPLILMETGTNLRTYVDRVLGLAGVQEQVALEMDNVEAIKRMVEVGLGISLVPEVAISAEIASGRLCGLTLDGVTQSTRFVRLVTRKDKYLSFTMTEFMRLSQETCAR